MNNNFITQVAKAAKRDGLTLQWSMAHLAEKVERQQQQIARLSQRNARQNDSDAQMLQVESEALALVLAAVMKAYPAGADITLD